MSSTVVLHVAAVEFTAVRLLRPQLRHLAALGYDVRLACAPETTAFSEDLRAFRPVSVAFPRSLDPVAMGRAIVDLGRLVHHLRPALVHFHSPAAALPGRAMMAAGRTRPRVVYTVHGFLHKWDAPGRADWAVNRIERILSRRTDALLFQSAEDHFNAVASGYRGRLVHLGNGVADDWFGRGFHQAREGNLRAIYVGRLTREKGLCELLDVARGTPDVQWTIVGDALPSDRDSVAADVARSAAASGGRICATGMVPPDRVRAYLEDAQVLVLPSWREGVPRSVIEGMASGLPVIATDIRGCRELVEPGVTGWLVPPRDPTSLAAAIRHVAELPERRLVEMGRAGQAKAWEQNREHVVFDRIAEVYRELGVLPRRAASP